MSCDSYYRCYTREEILICKVDRRQRRCEGSQRPDLADM